MEKIREAKDIAWKSAHKGNCNPFLCDHKPSAEEWMPVLLLTLAEEIRMEIDFKEKWGRFNGGFGEAEKVITEIQKSFEEMLNNA